MLNSVKKRVLIGLISLLATGCVSVASTGAARTPSAGAPLASPEMAADADLKSRLDRIIDGRLSGREAVRALGTFRIGGYDIQDRDTFWGQRSVGGGGSPFSEYYLTYRRRYVIMLLRDEGEQHTCLDVRMMEKTNDDYELTTGRVEVDGVVDEEVIVLFNRNWRGDSSTDIIAAFKANVETGRIEEAKYRSIRIYREDQAGSVPELLAYQEQRHAPAQEERLVLDNQELSDPAAHFPRG